MQENARSASLLRRAMAAAIILVAPGCLTVPKANERENQVVPQSVEYATIRGRDTLGFELATQCPGRIIGDIEWKSPRAHVHYEAALSSRGVPSELTAAMWLGGAATESRATQILRFTVVGDTARIETWSGDAVHARSISARPGAFAIMSNYVGLLAQLVHVLGTSAPGTVVPLVYVGLEGESGDATVDSISEDSVVVVLGDKELRAGWNPRSGFQGGKVTRSGVRLERRPALDSGAGLARCKKPPFLHVGPGGRVLITSVRGVDVRSGKRA